MELSWSFFLEIVSALKPTDWIGAATGLVAIVIFTIRLHRPMSPEAANLLETLGWGFAFCFAGTIAFAAIDMGLTARAAGNRHLAWNLLPSAIGWSGVTFAAMMACLFGLISSLPREVASSNAVR